VSGAKHADRRAVQPRFKPYPAYNDSGVEWLGEIPAGWRLQPLWTMYRRTKRTGHAEQELLSVYRDYGVIPTASRDDNFNRPSEDLSTYQLVKARDLVTNKMKTWQGSIAVSEHTGIVSPAYHVYLPMHVESDRYIHHLLRSSPYVAGYMQMSKGIRVNQWDLEAEAFSRILLLLPSLQEQRAIAAFLDGETARIDALVAKKERLIALLQEQRTALITRAVTKGLDPTVPMKDSGVEWLGEIPANWEVKPLKAVSDLQTGLTLGKKYEGQALTMRRYLRVANVQDGYFDLDDVAEVELPQRDAVRYELRAGDVLMTEGGDFDKLGRGYIWEGQVARCLHQNHIFAVRPRRKLLSPRYLALVMSSGYGRAYFTATSKQSTNLASTNSTKLRNLPMPAPSVPEQDAIAAFVDQETARIDALVAKVRDAIDRLKELRTTLISAAVTGKIDVREEVA